MHENDPSEGCLHGSTLTTWRIEAREQTETLCSALTLCSARLWLDPADNQEPWELLVAIIARELWPPRR